MRKVRAFKQVPQHLAYLIGEGLECLDGRRISDERIHRARKQIKKARATLRLLRPGLTNRQYRAANTRLRDAAKPLSAVRDADVLRKAFQHIQTGARGAGIRRGALETARMLANQQSRAHRQVAGRHGVPRSRRLLRDVLARTHRFRVAKKDESSIGAGVRIVYRQGRKSLKAANTTPSDTAFHEWRKQVKYLRYQVQLLRPIWPGPPDALTRELQVLGDYLGEDHDLVVLRAKLTARGSPLRGIPGCRALFAKLDRKRGVLRRKALQVGMRIYEQRPASFCSRWVRVSR